MSDPDTYEILDWYDGPILVKMIQPYQGKIVVATLLDYDDNGNSIFYGACVSKQNYRLWEKDKIDLKDLFLAATKYVTFDLYDKYNVYQETVKDDNVFPGK